MNVNQNRNNYSADINIRISSREHPQILSINNKNIMCLKKKGYTVSDTTTKDSSYGSIWDRIVLVETLANRDRCFPKTLGVTELTELTKEKLINDCKECNVHTEIIYKYTNIFGNETQEKKILHWDKHYVDQLK